MRKPPPKKGPSDRPAPRREGPRGDGPRREERSPRPDGPPRRDAAPARRDAAPARRDAAAPRRDDRPRDDRPRDTRHDEAPRKVQALSPAAPPRPELPPVRGDRLEGRNVVYEALVRKRRAVKTVWLDANARPDDKIEQILAMAGDRVKRVERHQLDRMSLTGVHNGVIAEADELPEPSVRELLAVPEPFLVLVDEVQYEHNLGAVLRSALGAGVHGVIIPTQRGKGLTPVVQRVSMGGAEAVPVTRAGISASLAEIQRAGVRVIGADMDGAPPWELDLTGPIAFVLGGEDKGLTPPVRKRCDAIAGIPLAGNLQSLNVSVTAGILLFERVRQVAEQAKKRP